MPTATIEPISPPHPQPPVRRVALLAMNGSISPSTVREATKDAERQLDERESEAPTTTRASAGERSPRSGPSVLTAYEREREVRGRARSAS